MCSRPVVFNDKTDVIPYKIQLNTLKLNVSFNCRFTLYASDVKNSFWWIGIYLIVHWKKTCAHKYCGGRTRTLSLFTDLSEINFHVSSAINQNIFVQCNQWIISLEINLIGNGFVCFPLPHLKIIKHIHKSRACLRHWKPLN